MMNHQNISDEYLNSFIDNQLDPAERMHAFDAINQSETLKERVCDLRSLKEMVKHAYSHTPGHTYPKRGAPRVWYKRFQPLAASILLLIGGVSGWVSHSWIGHAAPQDVANLVQATQQNDAVAAETRKIIIHVSNSNPMRLKAALDETESLLGIYKQAHQPLQLELIANQKGVDLLRSSVSTYKNRISMMQGKYPNLSFMVCGKTINKLHNNGENTQLLPNIGVASSAADQINKRLHQGWGYIKI